jgi:hypothetical protein
MPDLAKRPICGARPQRIRRDLLRIRSDGVVKYGIGVVHGHLDRITFRNANGRLVEGVAESVALRAVNHVVKARPRSEGGDAQLAQAG